MIDIRYMFPVIFIYALTIKHSYKNVQGDYEENGCVRPSMLPSEVNARVENSFGAMLFVRICTNFWPEAFSSVPRGGAPVHEPPQTPKKWQILGSSPHLPPNAKYLKDWLGINVKIGQNIEQNEKNYQKFPNFF